MKKILILTAILVLGGIKLVLLLCASGASYHAFNITDRNWHATATGD